MRTLLSTRLFAARPLDAASLAEALRAGFPSLQLFAAPGHFDPLREGEAERIAEILLRLEMRAPWLHVDVTLLPRLRDSEALSTFTETLRTLRIEALSLPRRPWAQDIYQQRFPDLASFVLPAASAGARLILDVSRNSDRVLRHLRPDVSLCWDLAWSQGDTSHDLEEADALFLGTHRARLLGVRVAHGSDGHRRLPGPREAELLEEAWRLRAPGVLVYDVEDPTGFGSTSDWRDALGELHAFHSGGSRPPHQGGGGLFWLGLSGS